MSSRLLAVPLGILLLSGCVTGPLPEAGSLDAGLGEAVKYNAAVQTIDPDPVYAEGGSQPGDRGDMGAEAVKRYRTGAVTEVEAQGTTMSTSSGPK